MKKGSRKEWFNYKGTSTTKSTARLFGNPWKGDRRKENKVCLQQIIEKIMTHLGAPHLVFIDLAKAFIDSVPRTKLWKSTKKSGIYYKCWYMRIQFGDVIFMFTLNRRTASDKDDAAYIQKITQRIGSWELKWTIRKRNIYGYRKRSYTPFHVSF